MQASNCDRCYRRKGKCDRLVPCSTCAKVDAECVYTDRTREKTVRPDVVERLEKRLEQADQRNKALTTELARLRAITDGAEKALFNSTNGPRTPSIMEANTVGSNGIGKERSSEVAAQLSFLSTTAAGERQYLGSASGLLFADLVRASVDIPHSRHPSPPHDEIEDERQGVPLKSRTPDDTASRPSYRLALELIKAYFHHDYLAFPFLVPSEVNKALDLVYGSSQRTASAYDSFIVDMLFAITTAHVSKFDWRQLPSAESHHARAMSRLQEVLAIGGLKALHAIILLCQFRTGSSIQDNSGSMWHLVGIAARICFELGLHKRSSYPLLRRSADEDTNDHEYVIQESKRRTFWSVVALDRVTSIILGRPFAIRDEDYDHYCTEADNSTPSIASLEPTSSKQPFVFYHIVKYRILCGKITATLHRKRTRDITPDEAFRLRDDLCQELEQWYDDIIRLDLQEVNVQVPLQQRSCFLSLDWYKLIRANALLMIWRPAPFFADIPENDGTLQHIFSASKQAITLYASLHKTRQLNYSWITLQSVFMAGLSYIFAVSSHFRARRTHHTHMQPQPPARRLQQDPSPVEVVNDTRACSKVLVAVSERWNALRHCHDVFDRLSDAVLADAVKIQTMAPTVSGYQQHQQAQQPNPISFTPNNLPAPDTLPRQHAEADPSSEWMVNTNMMSPSVWGFSAYSPLAVDSEFIHCYNDLQDLYMLQQIDDPVMELSQDWLGYLGNGGAEIQRRYLQQARGNSMSML